MGGALGLCGIVCVLLSIGTCALAKGAPHEIEGLIWLLTGVIFFVGAAIVDAVERGARKEERDLKDGRLARCGACKGAIALDAARCRHCGVVITQAGTR